MLLYHVRINVLADPQTAPALYAGAVGKAVYLLTMGGQQAVMCFFVISGFLVGGSVALQVRRGKFSFGSYTLNRATRLYIVLLPALLIGLALDLFRIMKFGLSGPPAAGGEFAGSYMLRTFAGNVFFLQDVVTPTLGSNNPLWSVSDEAWYYVLFPLLLAPFMPWKTITARVALFLLALVAIAALLRGNKEVVMLFGVWLLGFAVRFLRFRLFPSLTAAWLLAVAATLLYPLYKHHVPGTFIFPALSFANVLLTASGTTNDPAPHIAAFNAKLASFSFSLYVLHAPMLHFLLTTFSGKSNPRLGLTINGHSLALMLFLILGLSLYAWGFSLFTERNTDAVRQWLILKSRSWLFPSA